MSLISPVPGFWCEPHPVVRHSPPLALQQLPSIASWRQRRVPAALPCRQPCHTGSPEAHGAEERDPASQAFPRLHTTGLFLKLVTGTRPWSLRRAPHLPCPRQGLEGERQKKKKIIKKN